MAELFFWLFISLVLYTYIGYWVLLILLSLINRKKVNKDTAFRPRVSMIIAAYNEEESIRNKIENCFALDYPKDLMEIIVTSDCSSDRTDAIVQEYTDRGVILYRNTNRAGKTEAQNKAVEIASGSILVFSDATTVYAADTISKIVRNFADRSVGCVEGKLLFVNHMRSRNVRENSFFTKIELFIREKESDVNSVVGVSGCLYAVRKDLYQPMDKDLVSDLAISFIIHDQGYRIVHENEAIAFEEATHNIEVEMRRNIRTVCQGWVAAVILFAGRIKKGSLFRFDFFTFQFLSHKVLRWISPILLAGVLIQNIFIIKKPAHIMFSLFFYCQLLFYVFGLSSIYLKKHYAGKFKLLNIPVYFLLYNIASLMGLLKFILGDKKPAWSTIR